MGTAGEFQAMIVLDTNVLSAVMRDPADPVVVEWLDDQPVASIWTTAVTVFEIAAGIARLPNGRRRRDLTAAFERLVEGHLEGRVAVLDGESARAAAAINTEREALGRPVDPRDCMIAGIVRSRRATLATRNRRDFDDIGVRLVDPWAR